MSEVSSFVEIDGQHVELLPARTVMSMFVAGKGSGGDGGVAATGGKGTGDVGLSVLGITVLGDQTNSSADGVGGAGGSAHGGRG
jgi:hypothetical protein